MANTGLRPDEANGALQFRDVTIVEDEGSSETILEIEVRGKRGVGYCKSMTGAVRPFERLKVVQRRCGSTSGTRRNQRETRMPSRRPSFRNGSANCSTRSSTKKISRSTATDKPRTAYSLRHTYICLRLMEGADIYQIAKNCRTSVEMIEKYYASHIKTSLDAAAINIMRPKPKKKRSQAERSRKELALKDILAAV